MSLKAEEFANGTLKLILSKIFGFTAQSVPDPTKDLSIHPRSNTISTSQYVGDTCHADEKGQGHVRPKSSGKQFFTATINTPLPFLTSFTPLDLSLSRSSFSNPSAAATPSSPVRKSFTASTSSLSYSRRSRKSSLRRRRSCPPSPS